MEKISRLVLDSSPNERLLPKQLWVVYVMAPLAASVLLVDGLWSLNTNAALREIAAVAIPFVALTGVFHPLYVLVMPRLRLQSLSRSQRALLHVTVITVVAIGLAYAVFPLHNRVCRSQVSLIQFATSCVLISYLMLIPALLVQAQRNKIDEIARQVVAERQASLRAQLDALQARTNPHFFFNAINTVATLISEDPVLAERTLERLADLFRYALDSAKHANVPLSKEFEIAGDYLEIQRARFGTRLKVSVSMDPSLADFMVPPLTLQPLIENAVLHGLGTRLQGEVHVSARAEGTVAVIEVRDDGPGPSGSKHQGTQTSMRELAQRLSIFFGEQAAFSLTPAPSGGCLARITVPTGR